MRGTIVDIMGRKPRCDTFKISNDVNKFGTPAMQLYGLVPGNQCVLDLGHIGPCKFDDEETKTCTGLIS